jgi:ribonuclease HI
MTEDVTPFPSTVRISFDGGCSPEGEGSAAVAIHFPNGLICVDWRYLGNFQTNNTAEWAAMCDLLFTAFTSSSPAIKSADLIVITGDSKLVIEQLKGNWNVNKEHLVPYVERATAFLSAVTQVKTVLMEHLPREANTAADYGTKRALETKTNGRVIMDRKGNQYESIGSSYQ